MSIHVETIGTRSSSSITTSRFTNRSITAWSRSGTITKSGRGKVQVIWGLSARPLDANTCEYTKHINAYTTDEFMEFLKEHGIPFAKAAEARQTASDAHNKEETPNFARSIEARALGKGRHSFE